MLLSYPLIALILSVAGAAPTVQFRDVTVSGPSGTLSLEKRWSDTVGTAARVNGPALKHSVVHTSRTGPLSPVYRQALSSVRRPCEFDKDTKCEIAINGFGTVGEVQYDFFDAVKNIGGRSTQVMVACRCMDKECGKAVLIRPVNVFEETPPPQKAKPIRKTCLYESVGRSFSNCHTELLRNVPRSIGERPEYTRGQNAFVYTVDADDLKFKWTAQGQRGWTHDCTAADVTALPKVTLEDPTIHRSEHQTPAANSCKPPERSSISYVQEEEAEAGEACYATYEYAAAAASKVATQQDEIAIGNLEESYIDSKPALVSDTELALTCSAAGLGVLVVWSIFRKQLKRPNTSGRYLATVISVQVLSYALEALPLHMALFQEIDARSWISEFAFIDGSVALASDQTKAEGNAEGSILVLTAVLGTVRYFSTRVAVVASLTIAFDIIALSIILLTFARKRLSSRRAKRTGVPEGRSRHWMNHIVGFRSREQQRQNDVVLLQLKAMEGKMRELEGTNASPDETATDVSTDGNGQRSVTHGQSVGSEGLSRVESHSSHELDSKNMSIDALESINSTGATGASFSGNGSHTSRESVAEHRPEYNNDGRHCRP